jgi:hypothetical protein
VHFSPEAEKYSLDSDHDGKIEPADFESVRGRITAPVDDPPEVAREVKRLRAEDILAERAKCREEAQADLIIAEEEKRIRMESRIPMHKAVDGAGAYALNALKAQGRPVPIQGTQTRPQSVRVPMRQTHQARRRRIERDMVPTVTQNASFKGIGHGLGAFSKGIMGTPDMPSERHHDTPVDHMSGLSTVLIGSGRLVWYPTLMPSAVTASPCGHGARLDSILITPMTCQASAGKAPGHLMDNYTKALAHTGNGKKKKTKNIMAVPVFDFKLF